MIRIAAMLFGCCLAFAVAGAPSASAAGTLDGFSEAQLARALREALAESTTRSIAKLGRVDGYLGDPKVRIALPPPLKRLEKSLKLFGMERELKDLTVAMNRAAEAAAPEAQAVMLDAIKGIGLADARAILTGPDDAATRYFERAARTPLSARLLPIVQRATAKVGLAREYGRLVERGARYGVLDPAAADLDAWVTRKALDGLFLTIAEQERAIRRDPAGQAERLLREVFGSI